MDYPKYKKVAWRFARVFIGAFLVNVSVNWNSVNKVEDLVPLLLVPALSAGLVAVFKALREYIAKGEYTSLLHKFVI